MSTHDVFPDLSERRNLHGSLHLNVTLGEIGSVLTALDDAGFDVEINVAPRTASLSDTGGKR